MSKNKTPLLRPMRQTGATLYVFPSATEDIGLNINNGTSGVALSHYALLNLTKENFNFANTNEIVKSLQNYAMNFETVLVNDDNYNFQEPYTVSENVFWHWINKTWKTNHPTENLFSQIGSKNIYREKNYASKDENRIVQCFGSIDSGNSLATEFGMYNETYVTIPTSYGNGPVFFRRVDDNQNYLKDNEYKPTDTTSIENRNSTDAGYLGSITPIFEDGAQYYKDSLPIEIVKDIPTIQSALRTVSGDNTISISSYDDVNIDQNGIFKTIIESGVSNYDMSEQCEYKFNAILLYYSIYDNNDIHKQAVATNLFGIVFLDGGSYAHEKYLMIPMTKKKSFSGQTNKNAYFGNSYSFRVNIKTLSVYDNTDARIDDNTTTTSSYAQDFGDVISNLNKAIDVMNTNVQTTMAIQDKYTTIMSYYVETKNKLNDIEADLSNVINDRVRKSLTELNQAIDEKVAEIREELGLDDVSGLSSDGSELYSTPNRKTIMVKESSEMMTYSAPISRNTSRNGLIADTKVDIVSGSSVNINADTIVTMTSDDIKFNIKTPDGEVSTVTLLAILKKLEELQTAVVDIINSKNQVSVDDEVEETTDNVTEILINAGIIPITDILPPRAKKPEQAGYYLKENTSGNILTYVLFDGNEYTETVKCECGKMYSVKGLIYIFDGETCKLLGA